MASKHIRADVNLAFPTAEIAVMGPEGAVNIVFRKEIAGRGRSRARRARASSTEYKAKFANPYKAAELGFIDEVIYPRLLRTRLARALELLTRQARQEPAEEARQHPLVTD